MQNVRVDIDTDGILEEFGAFRQEVEEELMQAVRELAAQTNAFVLEEAQKLHSTRQTYLDNLTQFAEVSDGVFVCSLDQPAMFIEEGLPENFDMKPGLLKNGKVSKDGIRYRVIPFDHSKGPSNQTVKEQVITQNLRKNLSAMAKNVEVDRGEKAFSFLRPVKDANGNFIKGKVHANLDAGGSIPGRGNTPAGQNLNIYQKPSQSGKTATMGMKTFRTVTSAQDGKWVHPGLEAKKILDKAQEHAEMIWEATILPEFLKNAQAKWK